MNPKLKAKMEAQGTTVRSITPEEAAAMPILMYSGGPRVRPRSDAPAKEKSLNQQKNSAKAEVKQD